MFYPIAKEMNVSVKELLTNSVTQKNALLTIAKNYPAAAVIRMTELWCEAASFGMAVSFPDNDFPELGPALFDEADTLEDVWIPGVINEWTRPLIEAVALARPELNEPLIVGVTAPYTLASVLNGSENFMVNCMTEPECAHSFLQKLTDFLITYIGEYKKAGANAVMLAEPSVGMISPDMADTFSNAYIEKIINAVQDDQFSLIYHNCGTVNPHLENISKLSAHSFHFGSDTDLKKVIETISKDRLIMGTLDPRLFIEGANAKDNIRVKIKEMKALYSGYENFVLSTGCDLSPAASLDRIALIFCV